MVTLDAISNKIRKIKAEDFAKMSESDRSDYTVVRIHPPGLSNSHDFGFIEVKRKKPVYEVNF